MPIGLTAFRLSINVELQFDPLKPRREYEQIEEDLRLA